MNKVVKGYIVLLCIVLGYLFVQSVLFKQLEHGDEGVNAIMGLNMLTGFEYVVHPSYIPGGLPDWQNQDLPLIGNTPLYSALLAGSYQLGGIQGMALLPFFSLLATLYFTYSLAKIWDGFAAKITVVMLTLSPLLLYQFQILEFEPVLTAFGMAGIYYFVRSIRENSRLHAILSGSLFGLAFLIKLYLIAPFLLASLAFLIYQRKGFAPFLYCLATFLFISSLHLFFVVIFSPADLPLWIEQVYLGPFLSEGLTGSKIDGVATQPNWSHPIWYYPAILYQHYFFYLPFYLFGLPYLFYKNRAPIVITAGAAFALVPLSLPAIKEPFYLMPLVPFLAFLAAFCLAAFVQDRERMRLKKTSFFFALPIVLLLIILLFIGYLKGSKPDDLTLSYLLIHTVVLTTIMALVYRWIRQKNVCYPTLACITIVYLAILWNDAHRFKVPYDQIAPLIKPYVITENRSTPTYISPNVHLLEFYLFQKGRYWGQSGGLPTTDRDFEQVKSPEFKAYVLGPDELQNPDYQPFLHWLESNRDEVKEPPKNTRIFIN